MLEASFTDMRHGGDGDLSRAYILAQKVSRKPTVGVIGIRNTGESSVLTPALLCPPGASTNQRMPHRTLEINHSPIAGLPRQPLWHWDY